MKISLSEIASLVAGDIVGNPKTIITGFSSLDSAEAGTLTFALEENALSSAEESSAAAMLCSNKIERSSKPMIRVDNPRRALAKILAHFFPAKTVPPGLHETVVVGAKSKISKSAAIMANVTLGENVRIGDQVIIYPGAYIGDNTEIGSRSIIYSNVNIYPDTKIGKNVIIHAGAVIGSDGFGYVPQDQKYQKIPQVGNVVIEDDVEIGANVCLDRATIGSTLIKRGTKIDNLTHIAHNCQIGEDCAITGLVGFAGSVNLGNHVTVGGMAGFNGHITVGDNTIIMAKSGVTKDIPPNSVVSGFPAIDHGKELELQALIRRLPEIVRKIKELEDQNRK